MPFADVETLVRFLSQDQADSILRQDYLRDALESLNRSAFHVEVSKIDLTAGEALYTAPTDTVMILGGVYDDRWLDRIPEDEVLALNPRWRDERGSPEAIVWSVEDARSFRLYPIPRQGTPTLGSGWEPGIAFDPYALYLFHTAVPETPENYLDMPLSLAILAREFTHESKHQDMAFADVCRTLSLRLLQMVL